MTKQIKVSKENHKQLNELKTKMELKSIDEVITHLIKTNKKFENSRIVRLVE